METELATLCQSCGFCCDGSLFGRVVLEPDEVEGARKNRLRVVSSGKGFEQPCSALARVSSREEEETRHGADEPRRCSIYAERPRSCREFRCRLFELHRHEGGPLEPRLAAVRRARELLVYLQRSGFEQADFESERTREVEEPEYARALLAYGELMERLERDFALASDLGET